MEISHKIFTVPKTNTISSDYFDNYFIQNNLDVIRYSIVNLDQNLNYIVDCSILIK